jgi:hypothetical protein
MLKHPTPTSVTVITSVEQLTDSVVYVVIGVSGLHPDVLKDELELQPVVKIPPEIVVLKQYTIMSVTVISEQLDELDKVEEEAEFDVEGAELDPESPDVGLFFSPSGSDVKSAGSGIGGK